MSGRTSHYQWTTMQSGDSFSDDGYKYTFSDRIDIDRKAYLGAEGHHHLGGLMATATTPSSPNLSLGIGGQIPAGTRVYYKIALVDQSGAESASSAESFIDTPSAVVEPSAPSLAYATTGGTLPGGNYFYALSSYKGFSTSETKALGSTFISVASTTLTNKVTLTLPSLPSGATGFNIYRRSPGETKYFYLVSTTGSTYVDNGSVAENCDRSVPTENTTNADNSITVTYPGATPIVPSGYTWKIYRTYLNGNYTKSFLVQVVEYTSEATPKIIPFFTDLGNPTTPGTPSATVPSMQNPSKILLTDGAEVQGYLPPAQMVFKETINFAFPGPLTLKTGSFAWRCPYTAARIVEVVASLGRGGFANGASVLVDVNKFLNDATPTWTTIFTTQSLRPQIQTGNHVSTASVPNIRSLVYGDRLTCDIDQISGGATPLDTDLLVQVVIYHQDITTTSITSF